MSLARGLHQEVSRLAAPLSVVVAVILTWELGSRSGLVAHYLLPAPSSVLSRLVDWRGLLLVHALVTAGEIVLGFLLAVAVGVLMAVAIVHVRLLEAAIYPLIVASQAIPKVALGPLFVVWLGFGLLPKVIIAFLIAFFPILIGTVMGLRSVEPESMLLLRAMGAGRWKTFRYLGAPNALPSLFGAMKVAITLATVGAIVGEFVGANEGLGYVLLVANGTMDTPLLFAALVLIAALAVALSWVIHVLDGVCVWWHVSKRGGPAPDTM